MFLLHYMVVLLMLVANFLETFRSHKGQLSLSFLVSTFGKIKEYRNWYNFQRATDGRFRIPYFYERQLFIEVKNVGKCFPSFPIFWMEFYKIQE